MNKSGDKTSRYYPVDLYSNLTMDCDDGSVHFKGLDGNAIFVKFSSSRAALAFLRALFWRHGFANALKAVDQSLKRINVTLFWSNSRLGILGSKRKPFVLKILVLILRIINLPPLRKIHYRGPH